MFSVCLFIRCGSVDGAYGPVKNPWKYQFCKADGLQSATSCGLQHAVSGVSNEVGISSRRYGCTSASTRNVTDSSDWYIAGGSSGGSAVAVASGVALAYVPLPLFVLSLKPQSIHDSHLLIAWWSLSCCYESGLCFDICKDSVSQSNSMLMRSMYM